MKLLLIALVGTSLVAQILPIIAGGTGAGTGGPLPIWTQVQSKWGPVTAVGGTTISVTLTSAPAVGNLVVCAILTAPYTVATSSIKDNASTPNTYILTPNSPSNVSPSTGNAIMAYLAVPTSGAGAIITATLGSAVTAASAIGCEEFHPSVGTPALDKDIKGNGTGGINTANTPTITPSASGELLVGIAYMQKSMTGVGSPWTLWPGGFLATNGATTNCLTVNNCAFGDEVILSSSGGATALSFTTTTDIGYWNSLIAAFK